MDLDNSKCFVIKKKYMPAIKPINCVCPTPELPIGKSIKNSNYEIEFTFGVNCFVGLK
jgi:hypothetical protein